MRGSIFGTPPGDFSLLLPTCLAQQLAIAAAHQGKTGSHKADGAVTQVMGFPALFGDVLGAEQALGDCAIGVSISPASSARSGERKPLSPL